MKITRLEILSVPFGGRHFHYIRLHTDEGIVGIGEAACSRKDQALIGALHDAEPHLIGADPFQIERLWSLIYRNAYWRGGPVLMGALSGIEHALWDIKGKALNVPVYELLGGSYRHKVKAYCWIGGGTPEACAESALERMEEGWRAFKFNPFRPTGPGFSFAHGQEVEAKVRAVREAVGGEIPIAVDGHGILNYTNAMEMTKRIEPYGVLFFEEPVLPEHVDAMARLRRTARVPIATGERLHGRHAFRDYIVKEAVDTVQPDLCMCGGILEVFKIAVIADVFSVSVAPHNPLSPLSTTICLHLDTVIPNFLIQEIPNGRNPDRKHLITGLDENPVEGYLQVPKGPGWGVSLNEEYIRSQMEKEATSCQTCDGTGRIGPRIARQIHAAFDEDGALLDS